MKCTIYALLYATSGGFSKQISANIQVQPAFGSLALPSSADRGRYALKENA
jgi:hypothetical protein